MHQGTCGISDESSTTGAHVRLLPWPNLIGTWCGVGLSENQKHAQHAAPVCNIEAVECTMIQVVRLLQFSNILWAQRAVVVVPLQGDRISHPNQVYEDCCPQPCMNQPRLAANTPVRMPLQVKLLMMHTSWIAGSICNRQSHQPFGHNHSFLGPGESNRTTAPLPIVPSTINPPKTQNKQMFRRSAAPFMCF